MILLIILIVIIMMTIIIVVVVVVVVVLLLLIIIMIITIHIQITAVTLIIMRLVRAAGPSGRRPEALITSIRTATY